MDKMWYYVKDGTDRQGPIPESELRALAGSGEVVGADLVWTEGQPDWRSMNTLPEFGGQSPAAAAASAVSYAAVQTGIPPGLAGWMTFVGVMNIVYGVLTCLNGLASIITIIGPFILLPIGVLFILSGTALTAGKDALLRAAEFDENIGLFLLKIKRYMVIMGTLYILSIAFTVVAIVLVLILILGMGMSLSDMIPAA